MDYEQKYKEICHELMSAYNTTSFIEVRRAIEKIHPELKQSDDERIRNEIIAFIEQAIHRGGGTIIPEEKEDKWIAYLERQKDAIGAAIQQGYEEGLEDGIKMNMAEQMGESKKWADELSAEIDRISKRYPEVSFAKLSRVAVHFVRWQKDYSKVVEFDHDRKSTNSEKPKVERSEDDERIREELYEYFRQLQLMSDRGFSPSLSLDDILSWLKSIRPKHHWKPSEEQMKALGSLGQNILDEDVYKKLCSLYNDLKALTE